LGSEARTRLGLVAVLAVVQLSFSQLFADGDYPGPILLGILLAGGIAIVSRRLGIGTALSFAASALILVVYLTFIFANQLTFYGLPTTAALERVIAAVDNAVDRSAVDYAPIPVRTGYVVMMVVAMWTATTLGEVATFRWKRPLIASLPAILVFAMLLVLGTGRASSVLVVLFLAALLTYWGLEAAHRLRSWGRWVPTWAGHEPEDEPDAITGGIARRMGAITLAAAIIAPLLLPAINEGILAWRSDTGGGLGGGTGGGRIDPLVSIAPSLLQRTSTRLFTVRTEEPTYYRLVTLVAFDGVQWHPLPDARAPLGDGNLPAPAAPGTEIEAEFAIENLQGDDLPAGSEPVSVALTEGVDRQGDVRYNPESLDLRLEGGLSDDISYEMSSVRPDLDYRVMLDARPGNIDATYTHLPLNTVSPAVQAFLDETLLTAGADTPFEELVAIQNRFRNSGDFEYRITEASAGASVDHLTDFITRTRQGFCQQFATAFAVLARALGYPTRVVVGFLPGEVEISSDNTRLVRGTDAHAWPEVYFEDIGWVPFEPTPRVDESRVALIPPYTDPGTDTGASNPEIPGVDPNTPAGFDPRTLNPRERSNLEVQGELAQTGGDARARTPGGPPRNPAWARTFTRVAVSVGALVVLFFLLVPVLKESRIRRGYARARTARERSAAAYEEFLINAAELAAPKSIAESARAYALRVAELRGLPESSITRLATLYEASEYAAAEPSDKDAAEARRLTQELRRRLWTAAPWWERATRLFSPRSLSGRRALRTAVVASLVRQR
jgi:transglutaminase-like putative cysteine protease